MNHITFHSERFIFFFERFEGWLMPDETDQDKVPLCGLTVLFRLRLPQNFGGLKMAIKISRSIFVQSWASSTNTVLFLKRETTRLDIFGESNSRKWGHIFIIQLKMVLQ